MQREGAALTEPVRKQRLLESGKRPIKYFQNKNISLEDVTLSL